jgi:hypothetical protein
MQPPGRQEVRNRHTNSRKDRRAGEVETAFGLLRLTTEQVAGWGPRWAWLRVCQGPPGPPCGSAPGPRAILGEWSARAAKLERALLVNQGHFSAFLWDPGGVVEVQGEQLGDKLYFKGWRMSVPCQERYQKKATTSSS